MKPWTYVLALTLISCNSQQQKIRSSDNTPSTPSTATPGSKPQSDKEICWTGALNDKTPIFIHYKLDSNVIVGEITYLNTKDRSPIRLLGTIEDSKNYRLLEFDQTGNITGVIVGKPMEKAFNGIWVSPKKKKELSMSLSAKDTSVSTADIRPNKNQIFGRYHYQYGENGFSGDFDINNIVGNKIDFHILSLTNVERGPNIAEVETDTIPMTGDSFVYKIPDTDSCEFKVKFYKDFAYISYTKGYCAGQFGLNATIDGLYLKVK